MSIYYSKVIVFNDFDEVNLDKILTCEFDVYSDGSEDTPHVNSKWSLAYMKPNVRGIEAKGMIFKFTEEVDVTG